MTTNVKVFKSTDAGAPTLAGTANYLLNVLDAVLINGYNAKTVTITRSGSTATVACTGHGFLTGQCVLIAGANETEYNGEQYITVTGANAFTFVVGGTPATPATGTITAKNAPAGWTAAYSGTNKKAYRCGGGNQMYLRVDDTGGTSARTRGYQAMTDVDTGTDLFPTVAQQGGSGLYWWKSNSADTTARAWVALATDRLLYLWVNGLAQTDGSYSGLYQFGDLKSYMTGDQFATHIWGDPNSTVWGDCSGVLTAYPNSAAIGHFVCRVHTYAGGSAVSAKFADGTKMNSGEGRLGTNGLSYPNPTDGGLYLSRVWQGRGSVLRGEFPGLWCPLHSFPLAQFDTFTGSGDLAGRTFLALRVGYTSGQGEVFMETSNTWDI